MRKLYTGPFGPMARQIWVQKAKELIQAGQSDTFLFILPTATLLKEVRDELLRETEGFTELNLMAFDDIAQKVVQYNDPYAKMLTNYELRRFYDRFLEETIQAHPWSGWGDQLSVDEVKQTIIRTISELKRSGITESQAEKIISSSGQNPKHKALADLLIRSDQELELLSAENGYTCLTYEARLQRASHILSGEIGTIPPWLKKVDTVWVDHFTDFFPLQFQLLQQLLQLDTVKQAGIYLPYQKELYEGAPSQLFAERRRPPRGGLSALMINTLQQLKGELAFEEIRLSQATYLDIKGILTEDWGVTGNLQPSHQPHEELWQLSKIAFSDVEQANLPIHAFSMIPCASEKKEVEMIAKIIKQKLLTDKGLKPSDFAIIVRDKQKWASWLHSCFAMEQIPLQLRTELKLTEVPLFQQLIALLQLKASNWSRDQLVKVSESTYMVWENPPTSTFTRWAKERGIREGEQMWWDSLARDIALLEQKLQGISEEEEEERKRERLKREQANLQQHVRWLTELKESLHFIQETSTIEAFIQGLEQFLKDWNIPQRLAYFLKKRDGYQIEWFKRDIECVKIVRKSLQQLWQSAKRLGELQRTISFGQFLQEWEEQWQEERVTISKGNSDGVACLEPTAARGMSYHYVYILGCNEGVFPVRHREHWLLDDAERLLLQENGTLTASHYQHDMEKMFFVMGISSARTELAVSFVSPKANESVLPSSFLEAILKKLPEKWLDQETEKWISALSKKAYAEEVEQVSSVHEYQLWVMSKGKEESDGNSHLFQPEWLPPAMPSILQGTWIEQIRRFGAFSEWDGYVKNKQAVEEISRLFAADTNVFSISQINEYMSSPLTFFFRRILHVYPMEEYGVEVSPMDKGDIQHEALRQFYLQHQGEVLSLENLERLQQDLADHVHEQARRFAEGTIFEQSSLWKLETERLSKTLGKWLQVELTSRKKASPELLPTYFELSFGMKQESDRVDQASTVDVIDMELQQDRLKLKGKIDRVDVDSEGNFVIFDYKSSLARYKNYVQMTDGTYTFQLPLYMRAMQHWLKEQGVSNPRMIGGAFYSIGENDGGKRQGLWDQEKKSLIGLDGKTKGYPIGEKVQEDLLQVEAGLRRLREGYFYLTSHTRPNPYYADNSLYRYEPIYLKHKEKGAGRNDG